MNPDAIAGKISPEITALLSQNNLLMIGAIFAMMAGLKIWFAQMLSTNWGQRLIPLFPMALGLIMAFLGCSDATTTPDKAMVGLLAGFIASHASTIGRTTLLGKGIAAVIGDTGSAAAPGVSPTPPTAPPVQ